MINGPSEKLDGQVLPQIGDSQAGIEAFAHNPQVVELEHVPGPDARGYTQIRAHLGKPLEPDLAAVAAAWPSLSAPLKAAIVAITNTATMEGGQ